MGGGSQVYALIVETGNTYYLRFFSPTQMLGDALAFLAPLVVFFGLPYLFSVQKRRYLKWIGFILTYLLFFLTIDIILQEKSSTIIEIVVFIIILAIIVAIVEYKLFMQIKLETINAFLFIIIFTFFSLILIISVVNIPNNFINREYICNKERDDICKKDETCEKSMTCDVKYFNDKYIFVEIGEENNKKIKVLKFDAFF